MKDEIVTMTEADITHSSRFMPIDSGKGKELRDLLRRELHIPENVRWFEVRFGRKSDQESDRDYVVVSCEYLPQGSKDAP